MKKILFIALSPLDSLFSCSIRNESLVAGLLQLGYALDIVTFNNKTGKKRFSPVYSNKSVSIFYLDDSSSKTPVEVLKSKRNLLVKFIRFIYHRLYVFEYLPKSIWSSANLIAKKLSGTDYSHIISSSDPKNSHRIAYFFHKTVAHNSVWIQYWGDPLASDITRKSFYPTIFLQKIEESVLLRASKIVYTSPVTASDQKVQFPYLAKKIFFTPTPSLQRRKLGKPPSNKFVVGYHGSYSPSTRNIVPLVTAIRALGDDWHLQVVGPRSKLPFENLANIEVFDYTEDMFPFEQFSNVLIVLLNSKGGQIPGKLYHLACLDRDILVIIDGDRGGEIKEYIDSFERFYTCYNDPVSIEYGLREVRSTYYQAKKHNPFDTKQIAQYVLSC